MQKSLTSLRGGAFVYFINKFKLVILPVAKNYFYLKKNYLYLLQLFLLFMTFKKNEFLENSERLLIKNVIISVFY